jgi:hypothetical protein
MTRFLLLLLAFKILLIHGCEKKQPDAVSTLHQANVYLKGTPLQLSSDEIISIVKQTDNAIAEGEYQYPFKVTPALINKIKDNDQFLEISFRENRFVMTDKFGKIEYKQVMIPLSGQFAQPGSITVFYGTNGYKDSPLACITGYKELRELLIGLEN